ncbi:glutamate receptor ionotropic, kainate 2-like [Plodia interpunctella]|uniref:glutamate receptor ionotropic, kainate 2-like n=1 Tax=Plodia interpunctella TaxID=58824 RepID=UPI002367C001|nr:glutamate receptor ionotropic, kainate 2-like [Plodia interpunctella]
MSAPARLVLLICGASVAAQTEIFIGVTEPDPVRGQQLAAAVAAALGARGSPAPPAPPVEPDEPLAVPAHVCAQARAGAVGVAIGGGALSAALGSEAGARAGLPTLLLDDAPNSSGDALAMHPHSTVLAQVCSELCEAKGWRRAVFLHEGSASGASLIAPDSKTLALLPRMLPPPQEEALLRNLLLLLKKSGERNFIVWCSAECCTRVLDAAQRAGLLADSHSYILLTLDLHTQPLEPYSHGGANITTFQLFDLESEGMKTMMSNWKTAYLSRFADSADISVEAGRVMMAPPTALVLAYDAATLLGAAMEHLGLPGALSADCDRGRGAFHAGSLINYIRSEEWNSSICVSGGGASWETDGGRRSVQLGVAELARGGGLQRAGVWAPRAGVAWQRGPQVVPDVPADSMENRTFTVLIAVNAPYVMVKESTERLSGNDRYEGFCIELIERLAEHLHFNYTFVEQLDGKYGDVNVDTGEWNGMTGRLMKDPDIDFAITDLTITAQRETVVDFTTPFMNLGITILFRKAEEPEPELFAFLLPFSNAVWLCLGFAYLGTSLILYVVGRLCPEEWQNPYPCHDEVEALENQFTLANALWFNLGAVLLQGSEIAPVAYGTRAVASVWWLFALIITSSYTANLATLLAMKSSTELIHNVQELADNDIGITYGAKDGGSTYTFFQHSQNELYKKMFAHMRQHRMPDSNNEGINKVLNESYAFLAESTTIEYTVERNCNVTMVGNLLDSKGYGLAMKKNSPYRQELNLALLRFQEAGILREMKHKWWKEMHGGGACDVAEEYANEELRMANFLGLFLVLVVGSALGIVVSCVDLAWAAARSTREPGATFLQRYWTELRFVFRFDLLEKPLQGPLLSVSSGSPPPESQQGEESPPEDERLRSMSLASGGAASPRRRRSSMHAASVRLARHATVQSHTPTPSER